MLLGDTLCDIASPLGALFGRWSGQIVRMRADRRHRRAGVITSQPVLGGLHHQYCRI
jgi:hypothetical protein